MRKLLFVVVALLLQFSPARSQDLTAIAQFAQSICGDLPEGSLTRTSIEGKVQANAGILARILSGAGDVSASSHVTYKYHCTIQVDWEPLYKERQDPRCGTHEE